MSRNQILGDKHIEVFRFLKKEFMNDALIGGGAIRDSILGKPFKDIDIWYHDLGKITYQRFFEILLPKALGFKPERDFLDVSMKFDEPFIPVDDEPIPRLDFDEAQDGRNEELRFLAQRPDRRPPVRAQAPATPRWRNEFVIDDAPDVVAEEVDSDNSTAFLSFGKKRRINNVLNLFYDGAQYQLINVSIKPMVFIKEEFDIGLCKVMHDGSNIIRTKEFNEDFNNRTFTIDGKKLGPTNFKWALEKHLPRLKELYPNFRENIISKPEPIAKKVNPYTSQFFTSSTTITENAIDWNVRDTLEAARLQTEIARQRQDLLRQRQEVQQNAPINGPVIAPVGPRRGRR